jgi:DNA helicase II / ATP-dependent DNA helicase PcrA
MPWNLVLAGPGSGKSTVIIERAKWLSTHGVAPSSMAFCTFTNVGAKVLRRRLREALGADVGFVGTLHGMMLKLLRRDDPRWVMVGEEDADEFLARHAKLVGYRGSSEDLSTARRFVGADTTPAARAVRSYHQFMRAERMLDFDMVLLQGLVIACEKGIPWPILFVDEFQDSAPIDAEIYLAARPSQLFVVADPDQSIFAFRGSRPANVEEYWHSQKFAWHVLRENYRCDSAICEAANKVIGLNRDRIDKVTVSATESDGLVQAASFGTDAEERTAVARVVKARIQEGIAPPEIAVLCRTNKLAREMRDELAMEGVPVAEVESDRKPRDWRLLQLIIAQIGAPNNWASARLLVRERARLAKGSPEGAESWLEDMRKTGLNACEALALPAFGIVLSLNADFSRHGVSKTSHSMLAQRIRLYDPRTTDELVEAMRESPETKATRGVNVITVHASKGEEFTSVVIPGAELFFSLDDADMDEERRLFFVALTRARRSVHVFCAKKRKVDLPTGSIIRERAPGKLFETIQTITEAVPV